MSERNCNHGQKKKPTVKKILLGVGCAIAVAGSGALYQLSGMTPKVVSLVIGYWVCIPVMLPTGSSDCDPPVLEVLPSHSSGCDPLRRRSCPIPKACRCVIART